jgi:hypothetical protein
LKLTRTATATTTTKHQQRQRQQGVGVDDPAVTIAAGGFFISRCHNSDGRTAITPLADHPVVSRRINFPWKLIEKLDKSEKVKKQIWTGPDLDWMGGHTRIKRVRTL